MAEITGLKKLFSNDVRYKLGKHRFYGRSVFCSSRYGEDDIFLIFFPFGKAEFGKCIFGDYFIFTGIYRRDNVSGYLRYYRENYYCTRNPRTEKQQANRMKMRDAVYAWKNLTNDEKIAYNVRAKNRHLSGFNLFIREYLLSH